MIDFDNKKKLTVAISVYCSLIVLVIVIGQYDKLSNVINSILSVFSPIIIGFTIAYLLNPILKFFEKKVFRRIKNKRLLRLIGIFFTYASLVLFLSGIGMLVVPQVSKSITDLMSQFNEYKKTVIDIVNKAIQFLIEKNILSENVDVNTVINFINKNFSLSETISKTILSYIANNLQNIFILPKNILLGLFISFYALFTKERITAQFKKMANAILSQKTYDTINHRLSFTHSTFGGYFTGVVIDAAFVGIVTFLLLLIFNIPYASLVAVLVAITNVIPVFGPFLGAIPSAFIIFISDPPKVIIFIILIIVLQQIDGNIIAPKILGNSTGMSSLAVIVAITIMGSCFGFMGMFIGVPVFAVIIALIKELVEERLEQKGLPVATASYYPQNSMADPPREHTTLTDKLFNAIKNLFNKIKKIITKNKEN